MATQQLLTSQGRRGLTLIEVVVALVILTGVLLGLARFAAGFTRSVTTADARTVAVNLASQRISEIRSSPNYGALEATYNGTEANIAGFPHYTRQTTIVHTGGARPTFVNDYKTVTVSVTAPGIAAPIQKTVVVAAP